MMRKNFKRLQFDFSTDAIDRLDSLVKSSGLSTRAELIRNSLKVYEYLSQMTREGYKLVAKKDKEEVWIAPLPF